ncbi:MAG TPA: hypothetical protein VK484_13175 [Ferruginibacter sp.]|nr:hypothetical protein [Ferruginibacter sp.]
MFAFVTDSGLDAFRFISIIEHRYLNAIVNSCIVYHYCGRNAVDLSI